MHIGMIGGIGPAATDYYYRHLISEFSETDRDLDLTIVHADSATLLHNLAQDNGAAQVAIYQRLTERLVAAGAQCVVVSSIAGHFCIDAFKAQSPLPVVDILTEVSDAVAARGLKRIGILGTRTVMETRFYGGIRSALVVPPDADHLAEVHDAYVTMAATGIASDAHRAVFDAACEQLRHEAGVEAIMLGGTDLTLVYDDETAAFPLVNCAAIHVEAVFRRSLATLR